MNRLATELVKGILSEAEVPRKEVVGMFGGGFKPPTVGHLEVVKRALDENPEMDRMIVLVGSGERDSITQEEALNIWRIYQKYLPKKLKFNLPLKVNPLSEQFILMARKTLTKLFIGFQGLEKEMKMMLLI